MTEIRQIRPEGRSGVSASPGIAAAIAGAAQRRRLRAQVRRFRWMTALASTLGAVAFTVLAVRHTEATAAAAATVPAAATLATQPAASDVPAGSLFAAAGEVATTEPALVAAA